MIGVAQFPKNKKNSILRNRVELNGDRGSDKEPRVFISKDHLWRILCVCVCVYEYVYVYAYVYVCVLACDDGNRNAKRQIIDATNWQDDDCINRENSNDLPSSKVIEVKNFQGGTTGFSRRSS